MILKYMFSTYWIIHFFSYGGSSPKPSICCCFCSCRTHCAPPVKQFARPLVTQINADFTRGLNVFLLESCCVLFLSAAACWMSEGNESCESMAVTNCYSLMTLTLQRCYLSKRQDLSGLSDGGNRDASFQAGDHLEPPSH